MAMTYFMFCSESRHTPKVFTPLLLERSVLHQCYIFLISHSCSFHWWSRRMPTSCTNRSYSEEDSVLTQASSWALAPPLPPQKPSATCRISEDLRRWVVCEALLDGVCAWVHLSNTCDLPLQLDLTPVSHQSLLPELCDLLFCYLHPLAVCWANPSAFSRRYLMD